MKRFRFRLEAVERIRRHEELVAMRGVATAQRALAREIEARQSLVQKLEGAATSRMQLSGRVVATAEYAVLEALIVGTKKRIITAGFAIKRARRALDQAMAALLLKRRARRAIEILREKALEAYRKERIKDEQKKIDDVYVMRAGQWGAGQ